MRQKIPALTEALRGRFNDHHGLWCGSTWTASMPMPPTSPASMSALSRRQPFQAVRELLMSIPGWSQVVADVFIAETGADMTVFPTAAHLASWAGVVPGCNE